MVKEVQLRRRETKSHLPPEVVADSKKILASIYVGQGPLRGLQGEQEKSLLCMHLGIDKDDRDINNRLRDFWASLRVNVPSDGLELNVSTDKEGQPYNVRDYVIYQWALKHKYVAKNEAELNEQSHKQYYIHDPIVAAEYENKVVDYKRRAYKEFYKMVENEDEMSRIIRLMSGSNPDNMSKVEKENYIDKLITDSPEKFYSTATDKHLATRSFIAELTTKNIIRKIGNQFYYIEEKLGDTEEETIMYMNDKKNSQRMIEFKAKLEEMKKLS